MSTAKDALSVLDTESLSALERIRIKSERVNNPERGAINRPAPLLRWKGYPFLMPGGINLIQGQEGSHKSRLAGCMAAALIADPYRCTSPLDFVRDATNGEPYLLYIDTERTDYQSREAMQAVLKVAGHNPQRQFAGGEWLHTLGIPSAEVKDAVSEWIKAVPDEKPTARPVIIIDVSTDLLETDMNDTAEVMDFYRWVESLTALPSCPAFVIVIHENPNSGLYTAEPKAAGHFGSQGQKKASTRLSIAPHRDNPDLYEIKVLKNRDGSKKDFGATVEYCPDTGLLRLAERQGRTPSKKENLVSAIPNIFEDGEVLATSEICSRSQAAGFNVEGPNRIKSALDTFVSERTDFGGYILVHAGQRESGGRRSQCYALEPLKK